MSSPKTLRNLAGQFGWVSVSRIIAALVQAGAFLLLAKQISPETFGLFAAVQGFILVLQSVFGLGIGTFIIRERAKNADSTRLRTALRINGITSVLYGTLAAVILILLSNFDLTYGHFIPLVLASATEKSADAWLGVAIADGKAAVSSINLMLRRVFSLILFVIFLTFSDVDPVFLFGLAIAMSALLALIHSRLFIRSRVSFPPKESGALRSVLNESVHFWTHSMSTQLRNFDVVIASITLSPLQAGYFGLMARLTSPLRILPTSLGTVILPLASRPGSSNIRSIKRILLLGIVVVVVFFASISLALPSLLPFLGTDYAGASDVIQVGALTLMFAGTSSLLSAVLQGAGEARYVGRVALAMTLTCLAGAMVGGFIGEGLGAVIGVGMGYVVQTVLLAYKYISYE